MQGVIKSYDPGTGDGVVVRDVPGTDWLRASCGWWTNEEDVERLLN